jgi:hypothetical protein
MKVHLEYTAVLDAKGVPSGSVMQLPDGAAITDVLNLLLVKKDHQKYVVPFVNGDKKRLADKLHDGDKLTLSLPVGGG